MVTEIEEKVEMPRIGKLQVLWLLGVVVALTLPSLAGAQTVAVECTWDPPVDGTTVDHYVLEHQVNDGPWVLVTTLSEMSYVMDVTQGDSHRIRVAGVDAEGNKGPYSLPSASYSSAVAGPGQPGQPQQI